MSSVAYGDIGHFVQLCGHWVSLLAEHPRPRAKRCVGAITHGSYEKTQGDRGLYRPSRTPNAAVQQIAAVVPVKTTRATRAVRYTLGGIVTFQGLVSGQHALSVALWWGAYR